MVLLSTKILDEKFKLAFYKNGISLVEEPMIKTTVIDFIWPEIKLLQAQKHLRLF